MKWLVFITNCRNATQAKDQESRSRTRACKDHAGAMDTRAKDQEPSTPCKSQVYPYMQSQEPRAMQGPRAREQEPKTKRQRPRVTRTMSQGACRSHILHQEPMTKSQGPRDQPTILQYSGQLPTDFLNQILITQKMHAPM